MVAITAQTLADEVRRQQALARSIAADQVAISGGKKLTAASQDPLAWVQVSDIGRAQAQQAAWQANAAYGQARASKADSNLTEIYNLFTRAQELLITASTTVVDQTGRAAVLAELTNIRTVANELVTEKDYQGTPIFDEAVSTPVPVSRGINLDAVGTRQSVSEGIMVGGVPMSLDGILGAAITAVDGGTEAERSDALTAIKAGLGHVTHQQAAQGVRSDRLDGAVERLTDVDLNLTERRMGLENTDLTQVLAGIQAKMLTLEAAQSAFARINQQTLFDLIR